MLSIPELHREDACPLVDRHYVLLIVLEGAADELAEIDQHFELALAIDRTVRQLFAGSVWTGSFPCRKLSCGQPFVLGPSITIADGPGLGPLVPCWPAGTRRNPSHLWCRMQVREQLAQRLPRSP